MSTITGTLSQEKSAVAGNKVRSFVRGATWALPVWAAMLLLSTLTHQPDSQTDFASFANYVTTKQFLFSHLFNSIGEAAIGSIGVIALMFYLQDSPAAGKAITGMVTTVAGNTITSSVFGAAAFAQTAIGHAYLAGQKNMLDLYNRVYAVPLFGTVLVGLLLFMAGGIFTGAAITASGRFSRGIGWVFALTMIGFVLSNFIISTGQSIMLALLFVSTVAIAWRANQS